ncbi:MAG: hypothetical protein KDK41_11420 [Leptospiraceae bacterium]|nr:hypothetical protein [Leptospiraceae bacterium]
MKNTGQIPTYLFLYSFIRSAHAFKKLAVYLLVLVLCARVSVFAYDPYADDEFENDPAYDELLESETDENDSENLPEAAAPEQEETDKTERPAARTFAGPSDMAAPLTGPEYVTPFYDNTRVSLLASGFLNFGSLSENLPMGFAGALAFEAAPRLGIIPELRAEAGYLSTSSADFSVAGFTTTLGVAWLFAPFKGHAGRISAMVLPGLGFFSLKAENETLSATKLMLSAAGGYEYPISNLFAYSQIRYQFIFDSAAPLHSAAVYVGIGMHLRATAPVSKGGF